MPNIPTWYLTVISIITFLIITTKIIKPKWLRITLIIITSLLGGLAGLFFGAIAIKLITDIENQKIEAKKKAIIEEKYKRMKEK